MKKAKNKMMTEEEEEEDDDDDDDEKDLFRLFSPILTFSLIQPRADERLLSKLLNVIILKLVFAHNFSHTHI